MKANNDVRQYARSKNVRLWEIADKLNISEPTMTRKLRRELTDIAKSKICDIIDIISNSKEKEDIFDYQ